jgi:hypothetical protein
MANIRDKVVKSSGLLAWNTRINNEITKLYQIRTNVTMMCRLDTGLLAWDEYIDPEIQIVIDKLNSLKR